MFFSQIDIFESSQILIIFIILTFLDFSVIMTFADGGETFCSELFESSWHGCSMELVLTLLKTNLHFEGLQFQSCLDIVSCLSVNRVVQTILKFSLEVVPTKFFKSGLNKFGVYQVPLTIKSCLTVCTVPDIQTFLEMY